MAAARLTRAMTRIAGIEELWPSFGMTPSPPVSRELSPVAGTSVNGDWYIGSRRTLPAVGLRSCLDAVELAVRTKLLVTASTPTC
jgi:hypothetical protein